LTITSDVRKLAQLKPEDPHVNRALDYTQTSDQQFLNSFERMIQAQIGKGLQEMKV
jgi:hypothetical protein